MARIKFIEETDFKQTEIGEMPEEWEVGKIIDFVNFERGIEVGSENYNKRGDGVRFIRVVDVSGSRDEILYTTSNNVKLCSENDVLITFDGSPGIVKKCNRVSLDFIFYILTTPIVQKIIQMYSSGVTIKHASKAIPHIKIPLPPLPEQKAIAFVLSTIQEAKEKTGRVIQATMELKRSMMKHLFTYGPVSLKEAEKVKLKETEIGLMPEEWEVVRLGDIFNVKQGKQLSAREPKEGKIKKPFLRTSNLSWGRVNTSKIDEMYFTPTEFEELKLESGDILVCEGGDIGRTALYRGELNEVAYQNHLHRLRPQNDNINREFFVFWMEYAINQRQMYVYTANRTTIPNLSGSRLKNFTFPLPPLPIQQKIASILSAIDEKIQAEEEKKQAIENLFKSMLYYLMSGRIRVRG